MNDNSYMNFEVRPDAILSVDIGYSSIKCVLYTNGIVEKLFKLPSVIAKVRPNKDIQLVKDVKLIEFEDEYYYAGDDALKCESESIIDAVEYAALEKYAPVFLFAALREIKMLPGTIATGLSIAQLSNSGHFDERLSNFTLNDFNFSFNVFHVPQGIASKIAVDKYGLKFPGNDANVYRNYLLCNIGFNTVDVTRVMDGETTLQSTEGIQNLGVIKIATNVNSMIATNHDIQMKLKEVIPILETGTLVRRGKVIDMSAIVSSAMDEYIHELTEVLERRYGDVMDKTDKLVIVGGASYLFIKYNKLDEFIVAPQDKFEYYDSIGMCEFAMKNSR